MSRVRAGESGRIKIGCVVTLLLVVGGLYIGIDYFRLRLRYITLQDDVNAKVAFAAVLDDAAIRRQLVSHADSLGIALGPRDWLIRRTYDPRYITIHAQYVDSFMIDLPGVHKVFRFTFTPHATGAF